MNSALLSAYPQFSVMETASPPVSPNVVAMILTIQNPSVTSGTLFMPPSIFMDYFPIRRSDAVRRSPDSHASSRLCSRRAIIKHVTDSFALDSLLQRASHAADSLADARYALLGRPMPRQHL